MHKNRPDITIPRNVLLFKKINIFASSQRGAKFQNGMTAEIIPIEPEQVMLLREHRINRESAHLLSNSKKINFLI